MALNASTLGNLILSNLQGKSLAADDTAQLSKFTNAIADAVVSHIKSNAVVSSSSISVNGGAVPPGGGPIANATGILSDGKIA